MRQLKIFFIPPDLKTWKKIAIILFALTIIDIAFGILYYHKVQIFISNQTINSKADAGVIFFGSYNLLTNEFDNDTKQKLTNAIHLYKSEKNDHIIRFILCLWNGRSLHYEFRAFTIGCDNG